MAGPIFRAVGSLAATASGTSLAPAKPTVDGASGILIAIVCTKNNAAHSCPTSGWSQIGSQVNSGASFTSSLWFAAESAGAPTFNWTGAAAGSADVAYFSDPQNTTNIGVSQSSSATGSTTTHTSTAITTDANNALAVLIDVCAVNTALSTPAGWTQQLATSTGLSSTAHSIYTEAVASSGSSSGATSASGGNAAWVGWQIEIKGSAATAGLEVSKGEVGAWVEPPAGFDASKAEVGAWLDVPNGLSASKVEVGAWITPGTITPDPGNRRRRVFMGS